MSLASQIHNARFGFYIVQSNPDRKPGGGIPGELVGKLPQQCIDDCSHSGDCDSDVSHWLNVFNSSFDFPPELGVSYLREFGAWDSEELADHEANRRRVLWLACCDYSENGEWFGLIH